jgi:hypothetical protein
VVEGSAVNTEVLIGFGSAALALAGAIVSGLLASRANRQAHELERRRRHDSQVEDAERILHQYRDPLLDAAQTLQSRIYNIVRQAYLIRYLRCGDPDEERYARDYTLFAVAEYLCWVEIVRRELRFLDLGDVARNRQLLGHLTQTQVTLQTDRVQSPLQIFRGRQRAIAELMMLPTAASDGPRSECLGYAAFSRRLHSDQEFASWFVRLNGDIDVIAGATDEQNIRLIRLQRDLIDLIDFLDPDSVRIPPAYRARIPDLDATHPSAVPAGARTHAFSAAAQTSPPADAPTSPPLAPMSLAPPPLAPMSLAPMSLAPMSPVPPRTPTPVYRDHGAPGSV